MIRKSFRIGLKLGLIATAIAVVVKIIQGRQAPPEIPKPAASGVKPTWPPLETSTKLEASTKKAVEPDSAEAEPAPPGAAPTPPPEPSAPTRPEPAPASSRVTRVGRQPLKAARIPKDAPSKGETWVEPKGEVCPSTHPVKAKLASKIFHILGGASYDRTKPDRCYASPEAAEADGLRASKR